MFSSKISIFNVMTLCSTNAIYLFNVITVCVVKFNFSLFLTHSLLSAFRADFVSLSSSGVFTCHLLPRCTWFHASNLSVLDYIVVYLWQPTVKLLHTVGDRSPKSPCFSSVDCWAIAIATQNVKTSERKSGEQTGTGVGTAEKGVETVYRSSFLLLPTASSYSSSIMAARQRVMLLVAVALSLPGLINSFLPLFSFDGNSTTHRDITQRAVFRKTAEVCRDIAASEGRDFSLTVSWKATLKQRNLVNWGAYLDYVFYGLYFFPLCDNNLRFLETFLQWWRKCSDPLQK